MSIYVGSARIDEHGHITGGKKGDQKQTVSKNDYKGEVSSQLFYVHSKGWMICRPKKVEDANAIAKENKAACDNKNYGYSQNDRYDGVNAAKKLKSLGDATKPHNVDCSSLTRAEIITACGVDVGDFTTANCAAVLYASGLFEKAVPFISLDKTPIYNGDILVTKTRGHVVTVNSGNPRPRGAVSSVKAESSSVTFKTTENVHIRTDAGKQHKSLGVISKGTKCSYAGDKKKVDEVTWYKVVAKINGVKHTGYVCGKYLKKL